MLRHKKSGFTALFCLALATTGCAGDPKRDANSQAVADAVNTVFYRGKWQQMPAVVENQAETIIFEQRVTFPQDGAALNGIARRAIDRLLEEATPAPGSLIDLSVAGDRGPESVDRLTLRRLEAIRTLLAERGYESALATSPQARVAALDDDELGLTVTKVMAVLPDCEQPQPLAPDTPDFTAAFGCSNVYNLGVMVADPADLERGRVLEPADAERAGAAIHRYRIGEEKPILKEGTN